MAPRRERELRFEQKMSDAEALMWNIEKDPWLNPSGAMVTILDKPVDFDAFRNRVAYAVSNVPRLRERVVPSLGRLAPPTWATDPEFRLDYHLRHLSLPAPGTTRQLFDLATLLYEDPFDRTRPLWVFVAIDGLADGRGALFSKLHHTISDGISAVRLSEQYMDVEAEPEPAPEVDLDAIVAQAVADEAENDRAVTDHSTRSAALKAAGHLWRRNAGVAQRALGELAVWTADPVRATEVAQDALETVTGPFRQLGPHGDVEGGSPLWTTRSRHRQIEALRLPLADVKAAGKALGGSVNDVFVAGAVIGALEYHHRRNTAVDALNISFVVSTRADGAIGGNSFTPTLVQIPSTKRGVEARFHETRERMATRREEMEHEGGLSGLAGMANMLPTSVVTQIARSRAAHVDIATSNLRGAPFPLFIGGAEVVQNVTLGPVAGTAMNITTLSYNGSLDIGMFIDPVAVDDPAELRECLAMAYRDLLAAGGVVLDD